MKQIVPLPKDRQDPLSVLVICGDRLACPHLGSLISGCYDATMNAMRAAWVQSLRPVFFPLYPDCDCISHLRRLLDLPEYLDPFGIVLLHSISDPRESLPSS